MLRIYIASPRAFVTEEVLAVKQTLKAALPSLAMPAVISLQLWVLTAGTTERGHKRPRWRRSRR